MRPNVKSLLLSKGNPREKKFIEQLKFYGRLSLEE
jgi:hypothetical protein